MVTMDIEMHSPTRRTKVPKRARSPGSPGPCNRPHKRISLGLGEVLPAPFARPWPHANSRQPTEEWVMQARALRIDSPDLSSIPMGSSHDTCVPQDTIVREDETMTLDTEGNHLVQRRSRAPLENSGLQPTPSNPYLLPQNSDPLASPAPQYNPLSSSSNMSMPPNATQSIPNQYTITEHQCLSSFRLMTDFPRPEATRVPISSINATLASKKPRFSMGPRADCEKCRLGIKGHSVHLD